MIYRSIISVLVGLACINFCLASNIRFESDEQVSLKSFYKTVGRFSALYVPFEFKPFAPVKKPSKSFAIFRELGNQSKLYGRLIMTPSSEKERIVTVSLFMDYAKAGWGLETCLKTTTKALQNLGKHLSFAAFGYEARLYRAIEIDYGDALAPRILMDAGWGVTVNAKVLNREDFRILEYLLPSSEVLPSVWKKLFYKQPPVFTKSKL